MSDGKDVFEYSPDGIALNRHGYPVDRTGLNAWALTLKRIQDEKEKEQAGKPKLREQELVVPGHQIDWSGMSRQTHVGKIAHLAFEHGWNVAVGESEIRKADHMRNGEVQEGKIEKFNWVNATSPDHKHYLSVSKIMLMIDGEVVDDIDEVKVHVVELGEDPDAKASEERIATVGASLFMEAKA